MQIKEIRDTSGKDSTCLICLYDIRRIQAVSNYVMVIEPIDSFKYTKVAFFHTDEFIPDVEFKEKAKEYLEYDRETVSSLANMFRNCHSNIDKFQDNMNAILYDSDEITYLTKKRLELARENPEEFYNEYNRETAERIQDVKQKKLGTKQEI